MTVALLRNKVFHNNHLSIFKISRLKQIIKISIMTQNSIDIVRNHKEILHYANISSTNSIRKFVNKYSNKERTCCNTNNRKSVAMLLIF